MLRRASQFIACLLAVILLGGCTFVIKPAQPPQFTAMRMEGVTFTPSIQPKATPPTLIIKTSRYNPISDSLDTIAIEDILVAVETRSFWGEAIIEPVVITLPDDQPLLIEEGSNTLTGQVEAPLPAGVSPEAVRAVWITYQGVTEGALLVTK